jgi:outer membrane receptor for ferrienterochelin and colicins
MNDLKHTLSIHIFQSIILLQLLLQMTNKAQAQVPLVILKGTVHEKTKQGTQVPLTSAKVMYSKTTFAFVDGDGKFSIQIPATARQLVVEHAHLGGRDTIALQDVQKELKIVYPVFIKKMKDVVIRNKRFATEISLLTPQKIERIGSKELLKAACCNLSESFETTPSVDVAFTDAVTGYKQIQLLGLAGPYTLITRENIPEVRGLASITGLSFTPGQWIEGMQLSKGTGSVVNGYEGLAGQINVELHKPMEGDKQFFNVYQSNQGRTEANAYFKFSPKQQLFSNVFLHAKSQWLAVDQNHDHYQDQPLGKSYIVANRWMWFGKKGRELQMGIKYNYSNNFGGSTHFSKSENPMLANYWGMKLHTSRLDAWSKIGKVYEAKPWKSMGLQLAFTNHNQHFVFGRKNYDADEQTFYANYIFQSIIKHTGRVIKLGGTMSYLQRNENVILMAYQNKELVGGVFSEYAHTFSSKMNMVIGARCDYHQLYGIYVTPRIHVRYAPHDNVALRFSAGKAYRSASIFSENLGYFSTNRTLAIVGNKADGMYHLQNERAYNIGVNATYKFKLNYRNGSISADYYYTHFINQVLADWEHERFLAFYNSSNTSYAKSFQIQLDYEPIHKMDIRIAYRMHDVQATYGNKLLQKPLNAKHRAFVNVSYTTRTKWSFDATLQWIGSKRIPSTLLNPISLQVRSASPSFFNLNAQLSKTLDKHMGAYCGVENVMNVMQLNPIIDAQNPFGNYFDGSLVWGSLNGRNVYVGLRWKR